MKLEYSTPTAPSASNVLTPAHRQEQGAKDQLLSFSTEIPLSFANMGSALAVSHGMNSVVPSDANGPFLSLRTAENEYVMPQ